MPPAAPPPLCASNEPASATAAISIVIMRTPFNTMNADKLCQRRQTDASQTAEIAEIGRFKANEVDARGQQSAICCGFVPFSIDDCFSRQSHFLITELTDGRRLAMATAPVGVRIQTRASCRSLPPNEFKVHAVYEVLKR